MKQKEYSETEGEQCNRTSTVKQKECSETEEVDIEAEGATKKQKEI